MKREKFCRDFDRLLVQLPELDEKTNRKWRQHLQVCPECQKKSQAWEKIHSWLKEYGQVTAQEYPEAEILARVLSKPSFLLRPRLLLLAVSLAAAIILLVFLPRLPSSKDTSLVRWPEEIEEKPEEISPSPHKREKLPVAENLIAEKNKDRQKEKPQEASGEASGKELSDKAKVERTETLPVTALGRKTAKEEALAGSGQGGLGEEKALRAMKISSPSLDSLRPPKEKEEESFTREFPPPHLIIREKAELEKLWQVQNQRQNLALPLPPVDFSKQMVLALARTRGNKQYQIVGVEEKKETLVVNYLELP
ncbi:MAG: hypothetical protein NC911_07885, partial [Candidatus Omnitrophica bacterium]|nr:hypothetical protein [Candidatus Omnitrophota bacterium]